VRYPEMKGPGDPGGLLDGLAERVERLLVVDGTFPLRSPWNGALAAFAEAHPEAYVSLDASEATVVLAAAGFALEGFRVLLGPGMPLLLSRAYDQIRNALAVPSLPVVLLGTAPGLFRGECGAVFQLVEDLALARSIPGMTVLVPSDEGLFGDLLAEALRTPGPVYLRCDVSSRNVTDREEHRSSGPLPIGGGRLLREGTDVTVCCCGMMVFEALEAAEVLAKQGVQAEVVECYSVKPLPEQILLASVRRTGACVVAEEHSRHGGLASAVAEVLCEKYPVPLRRVGMDDVFGQSGSARELHEYYALTHQQIVGAAAQVWALRRRS